MVYGDFKDLPRRILGVKAWFMSFNIAENPKYGGHQGCLDSMVYKFFEKKSATLSYESAAATHRGIAVSSN